MQNQQVNSEDIANNNGDTKASKPYRKCPPDFKTQVIGVYKSGVYESIEACAKAYDISPKTLYRWLKVLDNKTTPEAILAAQTQISELKKKLAKAEMENNILKKAAIYFANQAQ